MCVNATIRLKVRPLCAKMNRCTSIPEQEAYGDMVDPYNPGANLRSLRGHLENVS